MSKSLGIRSERIDFTKLFYPRSIGIIGASYNPTSGGYFIQVMKERFKKPIYLFNPRLKGKKIFNLDVYGSLLDIPEDEPIDYVIIAISANNVPNALKEVGKRNIPFVTIYSSGFSEVGRNDLEEELLSIAEEYNIRIIGPNCFGVYCPESGLYFGREQSEIEGSFGGIFQSGGLAVNISQLAVSNGCFISKMVSVGNAIDLSFPDFLEYFLFDNSTDIIGLYLESLKNQIDGHRFIEIVKKCNLNRKPVILWRAGYGDATKSAVISHTGRLAGNNKIWEAVAKQTGCCLVKNSTELSSLAATFKLTDIPNSRNIGVVGIGGGSTIEVADILEKYNINIPKFSEKTIEKLKRFLPEVNTNLKNPLDLGARGTYPNIYYRTLNTIDRDPNISAIVFIKVPERFSQIEESVISNIGFEGDVDLNETFIKYITKARKSCKKPIYCLMLKISDSIEAYKNRYKFKKELISQSIPVYEDFDLMGKALDQINRYREFLEAHGKISENNDKNNHL